MLNMTKAFYVKDKDIIRLTNLSPELQTALDGKLRYNEVLGCFELPAEHYNLVDRPDIIKSSSLQEFLSIKQLSIPDEKHWNSLVKKVTLRPFQVEFLKWLEARRQLSYPPKGTQKGVCAQLTMGTGKTLLGVVTDHHLRKIGFIKKTLIICRQNNKYSSWVAHLEKHSRVPFVVIEGDKRKRLKAIEEFRKKYDIAVIHYEGMRLHGTDLAGLPDFVILDEAQAISNASSLQSKVADKITEKAKYILLLSGGIAQNKIAVQLYHGLHLLDRKVFPSFWKWREEWCTTEDIYVPLIIKGKRIINKQTRTPVLRKATQIVGIKDPEKLAAAISPYIYQLTKEDIKDQLPPITFQVIETELYPEQRELYRKIRDEVAVLIKGLSVSNSLTKLIRLNQVCATLACLGMKDVSKKADDAVELILELPDEKALIFSQFVEMANSVYKRLIAKGAKALLLTGKTPKKERDVIKEKFRNDSTYQFLVSTIALEGTGSDFAVASYEYRLDRVYPPLVNDQVASRVHRLTSPKPVTIIDFVTKKTIEEVQLKILAEKLEDMRDVLVPAAQYTQEDINRLLQPKGV